VKKGYIKRYLIRKDGTLGVQSIYGPGYIFPLTIIFKILFDHVIQSEQEVYHYEAMTDTELYTIDNVTLMHNIHADPILYRDLLMVCGDRFASNIQRLENLSLHVFYKRVAHQLVFFAKYFGRKTPAGTLILIPLTQQDLADILSATRETVSLSVRQLTKKGLIKKSEKNFVIPDVEALEEEALS
jgi:CRP/FNR family transcriptional regulator